MPKVSEHPGLVLWFQACHWCPTPVWQCWEVGTKVGHKLQCHSNLAMCHLGRFTDRLGLSVPTHKMGLVPRFAESSSHYTGLMLTRGLHPPFRARQQLGGSSPLCPVPPSPPWPRAS